MDRLAHVGIEVHRVDKVHFWVFLAVVLHRGDHANETFTEKLSPMASDKNELFSVVQSCNIIASILQGTDLLIGKSFVALEFIDHHMEGINDGVSGDENLALCLLVEEVLLAQGRRSEVVGGDASSDLTVHLLRPRTVDVVGVEAGFHMAHGNLLIKSSQCSGGAGGRVTMDQNHIRLALLKHIAHPGEHASGDIVEVLPLLHDV